MNILIRVDSSKLIGSGHLMRCLTLAEKCRQDGDRVTFVCRDLENNLSRLVQEKDFELVLLPRAEARDNLTGYAKWLEVSQEQDAADTIAAMGKTGRPDRVVVDSYAIDVVWEQLIRPYTDEIFVIDDLANRRHDCDYLLEQGFHHEQEQRYTDLVPAGCKMLLGPKHALLREEFYRAGKRARTGSLKNILVFYGGIDMTGETLKALRAIVRAKLPDINVMVVVGRTNPRKQEIYEFCQLYDFMEYFEQVSNMAELMQEADVMLGAGGGVALERCFMRLPALVTAVAENQREGCICCDEKGVSRYLGYWNEVTEESIVDSLHSIKAEDLLAMSLKCEEIFC
ncbi:MAG: UDP-2,4-diacetamido-2,4,6-trideoxy-beta-L-altropyranose hydrolase [Anaerovibrio sp.]|uniref:UDP-2,4-diacetamido-2,4, 6-trideoxy-beta-L-altropyranose hydrolase n=1 Tax=Anaerovibrio sp. TaxID=1872532 RepID=UPI0025F579CB|nr:UDP-2,4-diacetamido-2,4,6-trideoxy-beta-L-altropyranose hydrolase [Anaerovibrio sp.]MCR5176762.1 UDP-2,4-diacetamido-2,4,6-trideoxy-beta-L-altropyranose hydrolase [Anaerovibrio sp.]